MKTLSFRNPAVVFGVCIFLLSVPRAQATITVDATSLFGDLSIVPSSGSVSGLSALQSSTFGQAGANAQFNYGAASSAADTPVTGGSAAGGGTVAGSSGAASANGFIPGATAGYDTSAGRASVYGVFELSAATTVTISVAVSGQLTLSSDPYGVSGQGENVFALSINGNAVLFHDQLLSIGPNESQNASYNDILSTSITLLADTPYYLWAEADSESMVVNSSVAVVPEPAEGSMWMAALLLLILVISLLRQHIASGAAKRRFGTFLGCALAGLAVSANAKYIGSDSRDICLTCGTQPTRVPGGNVNISLSEGNLREDYPVVRVSSAYGPTIPFTVTYNSYNADGSKAQLDTGLGFGWTHTYNGLLFQQRGQMFRLNADGRVTQYYRIYSGTAQTYTSDTGYFETMTMQTDGSFIVTNKNQSWWHFGLVPNTPFLVAGPVYRLLQMGDRNGNTATESYNNGLLVSVSDTFGRTLHFAYDTSNHLASVTDPLGRITTFQYDPLDRVPTRITDPAGNTVTYGYNAEYQMTQKVDRDGRTYFYMYRGLLPFAVADSEGQPWFSLMNPANWAVDANNLALNLQRQYLPGTTSSTDGNGNVWKYAYDTNGYISQMTAPDGATTAYTYDPATRGISSLTDANGNITRYQYDPDGNRTSMTDALGEVTTYTYEPVFNQITSMTDPNGRTTSYQYDARGNRLREVDPLQETNSWTYDAHGNILSATDKRGNTTTYTYDAFGNTETVTDPLGNLTTYAYDAVGNRLSTVDPLGRTTHYQYDALDRMIEVTNALNGITSYMYDSLGRRLSVTDPNTNTTAYQYDDRGRLIQTTDALGGTIRFGYDPNDNRTAVTNQLGHVTTFAYDTQNRLIGTTNAAGGVTRYTYDPVGNSLSSTDPNTNTTLHAYDALNRLTTTTNALGGVTSYAYSTASGPPCCSPTIGSALVTRMQDADGNVTFYHYDELNRRVDTVRKNSDTNDVINPTDAVTKATYDPDGNVIEATDPVINTTVYTFDADNRLTSVVDAASDTTFSSYDADGNIIAITAPNGNITTNIYDALNRVVAVYDEIGTVRSTAYDPDGNVIAVTDPLGHTTTYQYDALNRQVKTTDALIQTTTTAYDPDGNVISTTDRNGHTTTYAYDGLDRRTSVTDPLANTTVTAYDPDGNMISLTDANGHTTKASYDALNRQVIETYPDAPPNTRTNFYDAVGNIIMRTDQKGQVTTYSYDSLYFMTNRAYLPSGTSDRFTYDLDGRLVSGNRNGWVDTFAYDGANRLTNAVQNGRAFTYRYDIPGRVQTNTQPSGRVLNYAYDARNRLATLADGTPNPPVVTYAYDAADRVSTRTYRNGTTANYAYNANNWITSLDHSNGPSLIAGFNSAYDNEGNKLYEQKPDVPANSAAYTYDAINRLTNYDVGTLSGSIVPSPILAKAWNLDPLGNWSSIVSNSVSETRIHGPANELLVDNAQTYLYDADGNLQQDSAYKYSYDEENRLTQIQRLSDSAVVGRYFYDSLGRRIMSVANPAGNATTNVYFYDRSQLIEEQNNAGLTLATYVYGNYIDEVLLLDRGGQDYYYHQNTLWSPHALTDASGSVIERYAYDAYGEVTVLNATYSPVAGNAWGTPHSVIGNRYLYTGRELDEESGLYFNRARYYDPGKGRFLVRDALEYKKGMNLYEYASDNPVNYVDPSGFTEWWANGGKVSYWKLCPGTDGNDWTPLDTNPNKWKSTDETTYKYNEKWWTWSWASVRQPVYSGGDLTTTYYWDIIFGPHDWGCGAPANMSNQNVTKRKVEVGAKLGLKLPVKAVEVSGEIEGKISLETESAVTINASQPATKCRDWRFILYQEIAWIHGTVQNTQLNYIWGEGEGSVTDSWKSEINDHLPTKRTTGAWCWLKCGQ